MESEGTPKRQSIETNRSPPLSHANGRTIKGPIQAGQSNGPSIEEGRRASRTGASGSSIKAWSTGRRIHRTKPRGPGRRNGHERALHQTKPDRHSDAVHPTRSIQRGRGDGRSIRLPITGHLVRSETQSNRSTITDPQGPIALRIRRRRHNRGSRSNPTRSTESESIPDFARLAHARGREVTGPRLRFEEKEEQGPVLESWTSQATQRQTREGTTCP